MTPLGAGLLANSRHPCLKAFAHSMHQIPLRRLQISPKLGMQESGETDHLRGWVGTRSGATRAVRRALPFFSLG